MPRARLRPEIPFLGPSSFVWVPLCAPVSVTTETCLLLGRVVRGSRIRRRIHKRAHGCLIYL